MLADTRTFLKKKYWLDLLQTLPSNPTNVHDILSVMEGLGGLPPPLTAIETPRINDHEGNNAKTSGAAPKYSFNLPPPPSAFATSRGGPSTAEPPLLDDISKSALKGACLFGFLYYSAHWI